MTTTKISPTDYRKEKERTYFESVYVAPNYSVDTLINGNISECIRYLREIKATGNTGEQLVHDELMKIKEEVPERYEYVRNNVFKY